MVASVHKKLSWQDGVLDELRQILRRYWGYDGFRPLQAEAMQAVLAGRDSVVVLPTGGGKSICFQAPALLLPGLAVIVSPLISLMKDQVDTLADCGVPAAFLNSSSSFEDRKTTVESIRRGQLKLLYLSPERLMTEQTQTFLRSVPLSFFAIDEAHCISDWGHDFRPEYRALATLKNIFPGTAVHAYTATATQRVRRDIASQLSLSDPELLVGSFDRPNLTYRVSRRGDLMRQITAVIDRHPGESGIIYCIRRDDVDETCAALQAAGRRARPYHAGLAEDDRRKHQEQFATDQAEIIVATVAFGMGIDKPDVRFVIHSAAPKSLEQYQQESGRAGRDGLEAECCLFYSPGDFVTWRRMQSEAASPEAVDTLLAGIERFCTRLGCRHGAIVSYFGQQPAADNCGACDVCLGEIEQLDDALIVSQKILSCVARLKGSFGAGYVRQVLLGKSDERIAANGHDSLSTFGLLGQYRGSDIRAWIEQLVGQKFLTSSGEYPVLELTASGWQVLRGEVTPVLAKAAAGRKRKEKSARRSSSADPNDTWEGVDRPLFDVLRQWRRAKATERGVPPYVIFGDVTLRDLARRRPTTSEGLLGVSGIGEKRLAEHGERLLELIAGHCGKSGLATDVEGPAEALPR